MGLLTHYSPYTILNKGTLLKIINCLEWQNQNQRKQKRKH